MLLSANKPSRQLSAEAGQLQSADNKSDSSNWTAWWSELNSNFGCGLKAALAQAAATYRISAIQARESADLLGG